MARHPKHLEREITRLKQNILALGAEVEEALQNAVISLTNRQTALAMRVIDGDYKIDEREVEVEEECLKILALYQPVANDLRLIVAILKINQDLERIADLAVNVAERSVYLAARERIEMPYDFSQMAEKVQNMLKGSLDAFINADTMLAREICNADDEVDHLNREMYVRVEEAIRSNPDRLNCLIHILSVSRYLERIADHATNISEDVIYLVEGEIIRHKIKIPHD